MYISQQNIANPIVRIIKGIGFDTPISFVDATSSTGILLPPDHNRPADAFSWNLGFTRARFKNAACHTKPRVVREYHCFIPLLHRQIHAPVLLDMFSLVRYITRLLQNILVTLQMTFRILGIASFSFLVPPSI